MNPEEIIESIRRDSAEDADGAQLVDKRGDDCEVATNYSRLFLVIHNL